MKWVFNRVNKWIRRGNGGVFIVWVGRGDCRVIKVMVLKVRGIMGRIEVEVRVRGEG